MTVKTSTERSRDFRKRLKAQQRTTLSVVVACDVAGLLRQLAREHRRPLAQVLELGALVAKRELDAMAARQAAGKAQ